MASSMASSTASYQTPSRSNQHIKHRQPVEGFDHEVRQVSFATSDDTEEEEEEEVKSYLSSDSRSSSADNEDEDQEEEEEEEEAYKGVPTLKKLSSFCGSPGFFAPEMILQDVYDGFPADVWSIACVLLELYISHSTFCNVWMRAYSYSNFNDKDRFQTLLGSTLREVFSIMATKEEEDKGKLDHDYDRFDPFMDVFLDGNKTSEDSGGEEEKHWASMLHTVPVGWEKEFFSQCLTIQTNRRKPVSDLLLWLEDIEDSQMPSKLRLYDQLEVGGELEADSLDPSPIKTKPPSLSQLPNRRKKVIGLHSPPASRSEKGSGGEQEPRVLRRHSQVNRTQEMINSLSNRQRKFLQQNMSSNNQQSILPPSNELRKLSVSNLATKEHAQNRHGLKERREQQQQEEEEQEKELRSQSAPLHLEVSTSSGMNGERINGELEGKEEEEEFHLPPLIPGTPSPTLRRLPV
jgi:hypothetical protein